MTVRILAGIFILILAVSTSGGAKQPISIGVSLALSGKYAARVTMQKKGFSLWQSQINAKGGYGMNLQMLIHDDQSDPEGAKALYRKMIEKDKVDLVFGLRKYWVPVVFARAIKLLMPFEFEIYQLKWNS